MTLCELQEKTEDLISRKNGGIMVTLFYDRENDEVFVNYHEDNGLDYTLNPPKFLALDCYTHPNVYRDAEMRGISNPKRLVPVVI